MAEQREQRDMNGVMFPNDRKEKDSHPDFTGTAMIGGKMYWVSGWTKSGSRGDFYSLAFKPKDTPPAHQQRAQDTRPQPSQRPAPRPAAHAAAANDDRSPFDAGDDVPL